MRDCRGVLFRSLVAGLAVLCVSCGNDGTGRGAKGYGVAGSWGPQADLVLSCDLMITEVMTNPKDTNVTGWRWIEIYNAGYRAIDLSNIALRISPVEKSGTELQFQKGGTINPGEFLVLRQLEENGLPEGIGEMQTKDGALVKVYWFAKNDLDYPKTDFVLTLKTRSDGTTLHEIGIGNEDSQCSSSLGVLTLGPVQSGAAFALKAESFTCTQSMNDCNAWTLAYAQGIPDSKDTGTPGDPPAPEIASCPLSPGDVAVTEFMPNCGDPCSKADWFELLNISDHPVSLQGCTFRDSSASSKHDVKKPLMLSPGEYVLFAQSGLGQTSAPKSEVLASGLNLNATGPEKLTLTCSGEGGEATIFSIEYGADGGFPNPDKGKPLALCLNKLPAVPTLKDYHNPDFWAMPDKVLPGAGYAGTPGLPNPFCNCEAQCPVGACGVTDGCNWTCMCNAGDTCNKATSTCQCAKTPDCTNRTCGSDGCYGSCGVCPQGQTCVENAAGAFCARTPGPWEVVPTEILANASCDKEDWVELYNNTSEKMMLGGCILTDKAGASTTLPETASIEPGSYAVLVRNPSPGFAVPYMIPYTGTPDVNVSEEVLHLDCGPVKVFTLPYGETGGIPPSKKDGDKRISTQLGMTAGMVLTENYVLNPTNWCKSSIGTVCGDNGTPGEVNHGCQ